MMASSSIVAKEEQCENTIMLPNWLELPRDLTANILIRLGVVHILTSARNVCPLWWNICKDPLMWRTINMSVFHIPNYDDFDFLVKICCYAVDLSCGHLEEIIIDDFANDYLLQYITQRANHLRRLELSNFGWISTYQISDDGFVEAARKLSLLDELEISSNNLSTYSLGVIGQCCPLLKSLTYYRFLIYDLDESNDVAFTIAKTMPGLCYLNISGIVLTDVGLVAILDGCSLLESLYVHYSADLDLSESVVKRCHNQIKDLKLSDRKVDLSYVMRIQELIYGDY